MEAKQTNPLLQFGLLSAAVGVIAYIALYLGGVKLMTSPLAFVLNLLPIVFAVMACIAVKKRNGGFLEFGQALKTSFAVFVITGFHVVASPVVAFNAASPVRAAPPMFVK